MRFTALSVFLSGTITRTGTERLFFSTWRGTGGAAPASCLVQSVSKKPFREVGGLGAGGWGGKDLRALFWGVFLDFDFLFFLVGVWLVWRVLLGFFSLFFQSMTEKCYQIVNGTWESTANLCLPTQENIARHREFINILALCTHQLPAHFHPKRDQLRNSFCSILFKISIQNVQITMSEETSAEQIVGVTDFQFEFYLSFGNLRFGSACKLSAEPGTGTPGTDSRHAVSISFFLLNLFSYFIL